MLPHNNAHSLIHCPYLQTRGGSFIVSFPDPLALSEAENLSRSFNGQFLLFEFVNLYFLLLDILVVLAPQVL